MNSINYGKCNYCEKYFARKLRFHMVPESTNQTKKSITVYESLCSTEEVYNAIFPVIIIKSVYQELVQWMYTYVLEEISYLNDISW